MLMSVIVLLLSSSLLLLLLSSLLSASFPLESDFLGTFRSGN